LIFYISGIFNILYNDITNTIILGDGKVR